MSKPVMKMKRRTLNPTEPLDVRGIVKEYLTAHGYDGLFCEGECGCLLDDLAPCGQAFDGCEPGYKRPCDCGDHDYHIAKDKEPPR
jgi:hypothetical protein